MGKIILIVLLLTLPLFCFAQETSKQMSPQQQEQIIRTEAEGKLLSECEKAGGKLVKITECDNSESDWCTISEREQCYADQVEDGRCTVGEYSQEFGGIIGITPRVICDSENTQNQSDLKMP